MEKSRQIVALGDTLWYNNFKPTAVERRRNAKDIWKHWITKSVAPQCDNGFAVYKDFVFGFMI